MAKKYTDEHEWLELLSEGKARVGITDYAQEQLGDIIFVELPALGKKLNKGDEMTVMESVKAASEVYAPVACEVVAVNEALRDSPELINSGAEGEGWIAELKLDDAGAVESLMDKSAYQEFTAND